MRYGNLILVPDSEVPYGVGIGCTEQGGFVALFQFQQEGIEYAIEKAIQVSNCKQILLNTAFYNQLRKGLRKKVPKEEKKVDIRCGACGSVPSPAGSLGGLAYWCSDPACFMYEVHIHANRWQKVEEGLQNLQIENYRLGRHDQGILTKYEKTN